MDNCNCCCEMVKINTFTIEKWDGVANTFVQLSQHLSKKYIYILQIVLWNKEAYFQRQGYKSFPQINTVLFNFFLINYRPLVPMDGSSRCCGIKTVSFI